MMMRIQCRLQRKCGKISCMLSILGILNISCVREKQSNSIPTQDEVIAYYRSLPARSEGRWLVEVEDDKGQVVIVSKLFLGTAFLSLEDLKQEWSTWSEDEKISFCQALREARYDNLDDYLRFVIGNGDYYVLSTLALTMSQNLPEDEVVPFLLRNIEETELGAGSNFLQALALSKHGDALPIIKDRLNRLIQHPRFSDIPEWTGDYNNPIAHQAALCIKYLLELGVSQNEIIDAIKLLQNHASPSIKADIKRALNDGRLR